mgnify:CR=1 FL=1
MNNYQDRFHIGRSSTRAVAFALFVFATFAAQANVYNAATPSAAWEMRERVHFKIDDLVCSYQGNTFGVILEMDGDQVVIGAPKVALGEDGFFFRTDGWAPGEPVRFTWAGLDKLTMKKRELALCPID